MANIKSQIKRIEIGERNNAHHSARKSETRTQVKKAELAIAAKNKEAAVVEINKAISLLDKLSQDGIISTNSANRKKAHLQGELAAL